MLKEVIAYSATTIHLHVFVVHEEINKHLFSCIFGSQCGVFLSMGPLQSNDYTPLMVRGSSDLVCFTVTTVYILNNRRTETTVDIET